jgi:hypothetical protein
MKRFLVCSALLLLASIAAAPDASAFGWKDVLKLHRAGVADSLILQKIEYSGETIRLDADDIAALKEAGVSDEVISAILRTEAPDYEDDEEWYDDGYYYHPRPRPRVYVGFGWYAPYDYGYYDHYYYPRYARGYYGYYGYYGGHRYHRYDYPYRRYTGYRGHYGDYGTSRERTRVEGRIDSRSRWDAGYRAPRSYARPYDGGTRSRGGHGGAGTRTRQR